MYNFLAIQTEKRHKRSRNLKFVELAMKKCFVSLVFVMILIILVPLIVSSRHISRSHPHHHGHDRHSLKNREATESRKAEMVEVAGSRLPDCTHACGSCRPCRLVMVSFVCASIEEAETCPMAYKCMCKNKSYPVP